MWFCEEAHWRRSTRGKRAYEGENPPELYDRILQSNPVAVRNETNSSEQERLRRRLLDAFLVMEEEAYRIKCSSCSMLMWFPHYKPSKVCRKTVRRNLTQNLCLMRPFERWYLLPLYFPCRFRFYNCTIQKWKRWSLTINLVLKTQSDESASENQFKNMNYLDKKKYKIWMNVL